MIKPVALTCGEPAGIAAEITLKSWLLREKLALPPFYWLGDATAIAAEAVRYHVPVQVIQHPNEALAVFSHALPIRSIPCAVTIQLGKPHTATAGYVLASIRQAVADVCAGQAAALCTNPIEKHILHQAGFSHAGHTEFLGELLPGSQPVMMLCAADLRVVPLTVHVPLRLVAAHITPILIQQQARIIHHALTPLLGGKPPRIAVAALNPHAGESGAFGREELEVINPAVASLQTEGLSITGSWPADTLFHAEARKHYDVVLCMYHDQALIPLKTIDFWGGVNVTLGLQYQGQRVWRTSPDHGTALPIAGNGSALADSLCAALKMAQQLASSESSANGC